MRKGGTAGPYISPNPRKKGRYVCGQAAGWCLKALEVLESIHGRGVAANFQPSVGPGVVPRWLREAAARVRQVRRESSPQRPGE
jgi:hypothetical protein